ncbi:protein translocase subunit SecF [Paludicola sp. MB14-C6]|uniref:protein translocase subunit SecF n=1 Tax=Paludihabitans sp. MB14-C6 TaxID=3070656 RepID=UPI0027DCD24C|nr:protein translocase subunit SecF [Paludicola sp. MB14-C6]WMJ23276.1 protein translocase subunit SecF [Paludicola sp. MB14-C6]
MTKFNFDFYGKRKIFFGISGLLFLVILIVSLTAGVLMDISFKGGSIITYNCNETIDTKELQKVVEDTINKQVRIDEKQGLNGKDSVDIVVADNNGISADKQSELSQKIEATFGNKLELLTNSSVDPTIGKEFFAKGLVAVCFAAVLIIIYIAFRFKKISGLSAGVTGVLALVHDLIMVFGTFVIFRIPLDDNFIAVALTILGYSINDTIVIYDRVRENKKLYGKKLPVEQLVNNSINETLSRTLNTSIATVSTMIVVCIIATLSGVSSIVSFALPMIIGMISGVYSTVFIAGPLWVMWQKHKEKRATVSHK